MSDTEHLLMLNLVSLWLLYAILSLQILKRAGSFVLYAYAKVNLEKLSITFKNKGSLLVDVLKKVSSLNLMT